MSIFHRPRLTAPAPELRVRFGREPVGWSADLNRVLALPRRDLTTAYTQADVDALEAYLRRDDGKPCVCATQGRDCPTHLRIDQARVLLELPRAGGGCAALGVGKGKTLPDVALPMVWPGCKVAVLLIPANLRAQLLERDWDYYGGHWKLPNLAGGRWFVPGRPVLHVMTYSKFSRPESSAELKRILAQAPKGGRLVICDESHNLKDPTAARTGRFDRAFDEYPDTALVFMSGTVNTRSPRDSAHLFARALGDQSPYPLSPHTVNAWAGALDPSDNIAPPGALERLCEPGEHVREGFRRRRNDTLGVVWTTSASTDAGLVFRRRCPELPDTIDKTHVADQFDELDLRGLIHLAGKTRPDGEELVDPLVQVACKRQLASGFFHRWRYPRGEPAELIDEWFMRRQEFNRELREKLKHPADELDSPGLLVNAARRAHEGYEGPLPVWASFTWPHWAAIAEKVQPDPQAVWLSDFIVQDAAAWARKNVGIVWCEYPELGERIARAAKAPWYGGGPQASADIVKETGQRSIVASIKAHGTGKNLQMFCRNLVVNPPADGATWEQMVGRTHRDGQRADEVEVEVYQHTSEIVDAFAKAREFARFLYQTDGAEQRLLLGTYDDSWR